jgi:hypothetical protein
MRTVWVVMLTAGLFTNRKDQLWNLTMFDGNGNEAAVNISGGSAVPGAVGLTWWLFMTARTPTSTSTASQ